ncbi:MAG: presqualene diphosphate synthase HpnD [Verrucomicrobiae bacterium]|nr:presqualene diphosphate synthase HpnD [Verrucomicrobiae bacterium]
MLAALRGSNLALSFVLLPRQKRRAMAALYAFCRAVDDVADDKNTPVEDRRQALATWREDIRRACEGEEPHFAVTKQLQPVIKQYRLAFPLFDELLKGVETDLDRTRYEDWATLDLYCYRVASVVGLLSIEVFGYRDPGCRDYAVCLGKALQLTNILRDVRTDAERGRIYLPQCELRAHNVTEEEILQGRYSDRFCNLARSVAARARAFYRSAKQSLPTVDRRAMIAAELMGAVYWDLLGKLEHGGFNVFGPGKTQLSAARKLILITRTWANVRLGFGRANYAGE